MNKLSKRLNQFQNIFKVLFLKLRFGSKIDIYLNQQFGRGLQVLISNGGELKLGARLGTRRNVLLNACGGIISIETQVYLNQNVSISAMESVRIGTKTTIGNNVVIVDHDHSLAHNGTFVTSPVVIGKSVWIGANAVITKGISVGDYAVIGAGSVVTHSIPSYAIAVGNPARIIRYTNQGK